MSPGPCDPECNESGCEGPGPHHCINCLHYFLKFKNNTRLDCVINQYREECCSWSEMLLNTHFKAFYMNVKIYWRYLATVGKDFVFQIFFTQITKATAVSLFDRVRVIVSPHYLHLQTPFLYLRSPFLSRNYKKNKVSVNLGISEYKQRVNDAISEWVN